MVARLLWYHYRLGDHTALCVVTVGFDALAIITTGDLPVVVMVVIRPARDNISLNLVQTLLFIIAIKQGLLAVPRCRR